MTNGGTESILLAVKAYKERAKELYGITEPELYVTNITQAFFQLLTFFIQIGLDRCTSGRQKVLWLLRR